MSKRRKDPTGNTESFGKSKTGKGLTRAFDRIDSGSSGSSKKRAGAKKKRRKGNKPRR